MRGALVTAILVLTLAAGAVPAASDDATQSRSVRALVALPTPLGPVTALDDGRAWEVVVPQGALVFVDAQAAPGSLFHLTAHRADEAPPAWKPRAPTLRDGETLPAGTWRVTLDPAAGAAVSVDLVFRGYWGDIGGHPAGFTLRDLDGPSPCIVRGVCLP